MTTSVIVTEIVLAIAVLLLSVGLAWIWEKKQYYRHIAEMLDLENQLRKHLMSTAPYMYEVIYNPISDNVEVVGKFSDLIPKTITVWSHAYTEESKEYVYLCAREVCEMLNDPI